jgi:D-3-phosphoglycerate dehydrogenase
MRPRVLITDNDLGDNVLETTALTEALDAEVVVRQCTSEEEVIDAVRAFNPQALLVQWAPITGRVLEAGPDCRFISRLGIGIDMIDLDAAQDRGVEVQNVPDYCIEEVATHAFATALALWRQIPALDSQVRSGQWSAITYAPSIKRLSQATVGIVGLGRIGRAVAQGFQAWGCDVIAYDPVASPPSDITLVDLDTLLADSDIISLHAPLTEESRHLIDRQAIARLRKSPIIVNTSRGPLIDEDALAAGLLEGQVGGAALDVFGVEPLAADSPLRSLDRVLLTPHAAWASAQALPDLRRLAVQNIIDYFNGAGGD